MQRIGRAEDTRPPAGNVGSLTTIITTSADETKRLARSIGSGLSGGELIAMEGDLGSGKTIFVKGLALGLGIKEEDVSSPTFVFIHEYKGRLILYHVDLYRIERPEDVEEIGLFDLTGSGSITAIEWAERACGLLPDERIDVLLADIGDGKRKIIIKGASESDMVKLKMGIDLFFAEGRYNG